MERLDFKTNNNDIESVVSDLKKYLKDAVVGDPKFQAFFDLIKSNELASEHIKLFENSKRRPNSHWDSILRENEYKQALLEHTIDQKKITVRGYHKAYTSIEAMRGIILSMVEQEALEKFPEEDDPSRTSYCEQKNKKLTQELSDSIWDRC